MSVFQMLLFLFVNQSLIKSAQGVYAEKLINRNTSQSSLAQKGTIYFDHPKCLGFWQSGKFKNSQNTNQGSPSLSAKKS